jgi:hypothetical protein
MGRSLHHGSRAGTGRMSHRDVPFRTQLSLAGGYPSGVAGVTSASASPSNT